MLFSITKNPDLLTLHTRQQTAIFQGEHDISVSAWMQCLACSVQDKLSINGSTQLKPSEEGPGVPNYQTITTLSIWLDAFAALLQLKPCDKNGRVKKKLTPVSYKKIEAVHIFCPVSFQCKTQDCDPQSLQQATKPRDIPCVTLIQGFTIYENCPVLTGKCQYFTVPLVVRTDSAQTARTARNPSKVRTESAWNPNSPSRVRTESEDCLRTLLGLLVNSKS